MTDERITAYLLEELTAPEAEQFEEQCFAQEEWPAAELDSAEQDLIEAYIKNQLTPERHHRFEKNYLTTPAREERVLLARSFLRVVCSSNSPKPAWTQRLRASLKMPTSGSRFTMPRFASAMLAIAFAVTLLLVFIPSRAPQTFAEINLQISTDTRSANGPTKIVTLPLKEDALKISLALPSSDPAGTTYRVQWEDLKGPLEDLKIDSQDAKSISVVIPAGKLSRGQYALKLFRRNEAGTEQRVPGSYLFEVK